MTILMRLIALSILAVLASPAAPAFADVRDSRGRFLFAPQTNNRDPVNLIQIGGAPNSAADDEHCYFSDFRIARTPRCFKQHLQDAWKRGEMKERNFPPCNGKDSLRFRGTPQRIDQNNRDLSTHPTCKTQYNLRIWDDDAVNNPYGEWSVAVVYHETRGFCSFCDGETQGDHIVDQDWDTAENTALYELAKSTDGEERYCVQQDYRPVPGQFIGRDKNGNYNDGRISRVSIGEPDESAPYGDRCDGN